MIEIKKTVRGIIHGFFCKRALLSEGRKRVVSGVWTHVTVVNPLSERKVYLNSILVSERKERKPVKWLLGDMSAECWMKKEVELIDELKVI